MNKGGQSSVLKKNMGVAVDNQPQIGWLYLQATRVLTPGLIHVCLVKAEYSFSGRRRSRRQRGACGDFVNYRVCVCAFIGVSVCACI
jgi:hypothetical protein